MANSETALSSLMFSGCPDQAIETEPQILWAQHSDGPLYPIPAIYFIAFPNRAFVQKVTHSEVYRCLCLLGHESVLEHELLMFLG
jgi:hypothetical protein